MATIIDREAVSDAQERVPGDRFVATVMILFAATMFGYQALTRELIPPLLGFGTVFLAVGGALARRRRRWLLVTTIVLVVAFTAGSLPFLLSNIVHPESPLSFLQEAFSYLAALTAGAGAIAGLRRAGPGSRRPIAYAAVGLAAVAVLVTVVASAAFEGDPIQAGDVALEVVRAQYPERVELPAGAGLWMDNQDPIHHTLVVEGTDVRVVLPASAAVRADVDLAAGTYRYFCDVPGHERMEGELVVR